MNNELKIFENEDFGQVRVTMQNGEPWFVAADVCRALDVANHKDAIVRLDDDEKTGVALTDPHGRKQVTNVINEPGLYSLVLGSRKPAAKQFKRWITHEVIPSIRKTGGYIDGQEQMTDAELMAKALMVAQNTIAEREKRIASMTAKLEEQNTAISIMQPKAEYYDNVLSADGTLVTTVIAKEFGMRAADLNKLLHKYHVQYKIGGIWVLYAEHQNKKYQKTETTWQDTQWGRKARTWTHWTQEGRKFIHDTLREHGILPLNER